MQNSGLYKIDALLGDQEGIYQAANNVVAYSFSVPGDFFGGTSAAALTGAQQSAIASLMSYVGSVTGVQFVAAGSPAAASAGSTINFLVADLPGTYSGWCEYNGGTSYDIAIDTTTFPSYSNFSAGGWAYQLLLHEVGHALGLDHPFEGQTLPTNEDNTSHTLMSYNWVGGARSVYSDYDLLALGWIYGGDGVKGVNGIGGTNGPSIPAGAYPPISHEISGGGAVSEADGTFKFTITRSGETGLASSVAWAVGGTVDAADFGGTLPSGVASFAAGETSKTVSLAPGRDSVIEMDETMTVTLGATTGLGSVLGSAKSASFTLVDDDTPPSISIVAAAQVVEGNGSSSELSFQISRGGNIGGASSVTWTLTPNSAAAADFAGGTLPTTGTLQFGPGQAEAVLTFLIAGDLLVEPAEEFVVSLSSPLGATLGSSKAVGTIISDDVNNTFTVVAKATTLPEGHSGSQPVEFVVSRSGVATAPAIVSWARSGALSSDDFLSGVAASGTLSFAANETSKSIVFDVKGDTRIEGDEALIVSLLDVSGLGAGLGGAVVATTTVLGDDPKAQVSVKAWRPVVAEGNVGGTVLHAFTLTRAGDITQDAPMTWSMSGTADAADYDGGVLPGGTITFPAGVATVEVTVRTRGDIKYEENETLVLSLKDGDLVTPHPVTGSASVQLTNDDVPNEFEVRASNSSITEGSTIGNRSSAGFVVTRTGDLTESGSVQWAVTGTGEHPASASDFAGGALPSGTVRFAPGEASRTVYVSVNHDKQAENNEAFTLTLRNGENGFVSKTLGAATVIVRSDDPAPYVLIEADSAQVVEGDSGVQTVTFVLERWGDLSTTSSVKWQLTGATSAGTDAADFAAGQPLTGSVSFSAGEARKTITIEVQGDRLIEANETFTVLLTNPDIITIFGNGTSSVTLLNDDAPARHATGTHAENEKVVLRGAASEYVMTWDGASDVVRVVDSKSGRDGEVVLDSVDVIQFSDRSLQVLPDPTQKALLQLGHVVFGEAGLDQDVFGQGMAYLATASVGALGELVASAFFAGKSPASMAEEVLKNIGVTAVSLGGGAAGESHFASTTSTLAGMFAGDAASRGAALVSLIGAFEPLEADPTFGTVASSLNDLIATEWLAEFAGHPATLVGIPNQLVELALA